MAINLDDRTREDMDREATEGRAQDLEQLRKAEEGTASPESEELIPMEDPRVQEIMQKLRAGEEVLAKEYAPGQMEGTIMPSALESESGRKLIGDLAQKITPPTSGIDAAPLTDPQGRIMPAGPLGDEESTFQAMEKKLGIDPNAPYVPAEETPEDPREKARNYLKEKYGIGTSETPSKEALQRAQKKQKMSNLLASFSDAGDKFIGGMTNRQIDPTSGDNIRAQAGSEVQALSQEIDRTKAEQEAAKREFEFDAALDQQEYADQYNDPNSALAKMYQASALKAAREYGMDVNKDAVAQLTQMSPKAINDWMKSNVAYIQQFQSAKNRLLDAQVKAQKEEAKAEEKAKKRDEDWLEERRKWVADQRNKATKLQSAKDVAKIYNNKTLLESQISNPTAEGNLAAIFGFMKSIDPESVVRESEFATAADAGSLVEKWKNTWSKMTTGEFLQEGQVQDFVDLAEIMYEAGVGRYNSDIKPIIRDAINTYEVDPRLIVDGLGPDVVNGILKEYNKTLNDLDTDLSPGFTRENSDTTQPQKSSPQSSREGFTRVVSPEGKSGQIPNDQLDEALKEGYSLADKPEEKTEPKENTPSNKIKGTSGPFN